MLLPGELATASAPYLGAPLCEWHDWRCDPQAKISQSIPRLAFLGWLGRDLEHNAAPVNTTCHCGAVNISGAVDYQTARGIAAIIDTHKVVDIRVGPTTLRGRKFENVPKAIGTFRIRSAPQIARAVEQQAAQRARATSGEGIKHRDIPLAAKRRQLEYCAPTIRPPTDVVPYRLPAWSKIRLPKGSCPAPDSLKVSKS